MAMFTKEHYEVIATAINTVGETGLFVGATYPKTLAMAKAISAVTQRLAAVFEADSAKFDSDEFYKACGWE